MDKTPKSTASYNECENQALISQEPSVFLTSDATQISAPDADNDILVHYYPGYNSCPAQAVRYVGNEIIDLPSGEQARAKQSGISLFPAKALHFPLMKEIITRPSEGFFSGIVHWFKGLSSRLSHWQRDIEIIPGVTPNNELGSYDGFVIDADKCSLGQMTDIQEFERSDLTIKQDPVLKNKPRIYMGVSRGGAATFSALVENESIENVQLCLLEAPPSSIGGIFKIFGENLFGSRKLGEWLYNKFGSTLLGAQHQTDKSFHARGHVDKFPDHIPLLIVSSKKDAIVPLENSFKLALRVAAKRLQAMERGALDVAPVYFLQLEEPGHNEYTKSGTKDSVLYQNVVHAVYKKHGLPFIEQYAAQGEAAMNAANLMGDCSKPLMQLQAQFWGNRENRPQLREAATHYLNDTQHEEARRELEKFQYAPLFHKPLVEKVREDETLLNNSYLSV